MYDEDYQMMQRSKHIHLADFLDTILRDHSMMFLVFIIYLYIFNRFIKYVRNKIISIFMRSKLLKTFSCTAVVQASYSMTASM